jgi:hypothetical protein
MTAEADLHVEVQGVEIPQQLLTKSHSGREDHGAPMTQAEFHGRAWKLANDKAGELGWIV